MNFPSQIVFNDISHGHRAAIFKKNSLWLLPFYMTVATYCYYEKVRITMRTAIVSYLLKKATPNNCCRQYFLFFLTDQQKLVTFTHLPKISIAFEWNTVTSLFLGKSPQKLYCKLIGVLMVWSEGIPWWHHFIIQTFIKYPIKNYLEATWNPKYPLQIDKKVFLGYKLEEKNVLFEVNQQGCEESSIQIWYQNITHLKG